MQLVFNEKKDTFVYCFHQKKLKSQKSRDNLEISEKENSGYKNAGYKTVCLWRVILEKWQEFSAVLPPKKTYFDNHPWTSMPLWTSGSPVEKCPHPVGGKQNQDWIH